MPQKELFRLMEEKPYARITVSEITKRADVSREVVEARIGNQRYKEPREIEYFADYSTGGFTLLLQRWIIKGMKEKPEQYARVISESLLKYISPVQRQSGADI